MRRRWQAGLIWAAVALALAGAFALYASPGLAVQLADQLWACF